MTEFGPSVRTQSCHVILEEGHFSNKARRFQTLFKIYGKENVLSCSEERGIHYKFTIHYCHSHANPHRLLQTAGPTVRKRDAKTLFFPFLFLKKN